MMAAAFAPPGDPARDQVSATSQDVGDLECSDSGGYGGGGPTSALARRQASRM